jgi:hypothetical protein
MATKEPDWVLTPLEISDEEMKNAGGFALMWGYVEEHLDRLYPVLFRTDPTLAICITANLGTKAKVEIIQSALTMLSPLLPDEKVADLHETLDMVLEFSSKYRNMLAHGRPVLHADDDDNKKTVWRWARFAARRQVSIIFPDAESDEEFWRIGGAVLWIVIQGLFDGAKQLYPIIHDLTDEEIDAACVIRHTKP